MYRLITFWRSPTAKPDMKNTGKPGTCWKKALPNATRATEMQKGNMGIGRNVRAKPITKSNDKPGMCWKKALPNAALPNATETQKRNMRSFMFHNRDTNAVSDCNMGWHQRK